MTWHLHPGVGHYTGRVVQSVYMSCTSALTRHTCTQALRSPTVTQIARRLSVLTLPYQPDSVNREWKKKKVEVLTIWAEKYASNRLLISCMTLLLNWF